MRPIVGRTAGLIPVDFGPWAIMHFPHATLRKEAVAVAWEPDQQPPGVCLPPMRIVLSYLTH
jgi:hypothetical protein